MNESLTRRAFAALSTSLLAGVANDALAQTPALQTPEPPKGPVEAPFERDYDAPKFQPGWKKPQVNRQMAQDFVIYAHSDLETVKKLLEKEPGLLNASVDWGGGDFETALGGASHMGRRDIVAFLLERGARAPTCSAPRCSANSTR